MRLYALLFPNHRVRLHCSGVGRRPFFSPSSGTMEGTKGANGSFVLLFQTLLDVWKINTFSSRYNKLELGPTGENRDGRFPSLDQQGP